MAAVEHVSHVVDSLAARRGVAGGRAQVDVPQARGDLVDRDAGLETAGRPVGAEGMRVREPLGHARGEAVAVDDPVHRDGGEGRGCSCA